MIVAAPIAIHGCPVTKRDQAAQNPCPGSFGFGRMNDGMRADSMWSPRSESTAGRNVSAAKTAVITANAEVYPSVVTSGMPVMSSVTRATTTVPPAKQIALPAVATARAMASSNSMPSFRFAR